MSECSIDECTGVVVARGWCNRHWLRWRRHGSPTAGSAFRFTDDQERLWSRVTKTDTCWIWTGGLTNGYGYVVQAGVHQRVHRVVYETLVGPIPEGLQLDHLCRNRACCNPDHLEPVTQQENIGRGERAMRASCAEGHPYDVKVHRRGGIERRCSTCINARRRERYAARKTA